MKLTRISKALLGTVAFLGMAGAANATLIVQPNTSGVTGSTASSCNTSCIEAVFGATGIDLLYRATLDGSDSGDYENSYNTDFSDPWWNPTDATVDHRSGRSDIDCGYCYLVVRRDSNDGYYFFNLSNLWNGTEDLSWRGSTRIDQISIWGGGKKVAKVPEPGTLGLFGAGLLAIGLARRWKRR